ncbi:MAG: helix-turn-helix transcriptional regulator, partial [Acutalibacteraceae bacterium]
GREMFDLSEPQNANLNVFIELLKSALFALNGRFHIETRVNAIISELCMIYESQYKEYIASTDSIPVQILDFINKNFTSNITLDSIKDKFFVSKTTIIAIVKRITGMTFKQYITKLRLNMGKDLIESGNQNAQNAALLCGFNEYSAFYKAYKKMYQMPPSSQIKNKESYYPRV